MTDVWTDPELRALLREEPELIAIADAVAQAGVGVVRPRRRPRATPLVAGAVAVAAVAVLALVAPWQRSSGSTSSLALAALGKGPVLHAVVREDWRSGDLLVEVATGRTKRHTAEEEYWYDAGRRLLAIHAIRDGKVVRETLNTPAGGFASDGVTSKPGGYRLAPDVALAGFLTRYRRALADGRAHVSGHTTVGGRRAVLLSIRRPTGGWVDEVAVDADSYRPLRYRTVNPTQSDYVPSWETISVIESIPRASGQFVKPAVVHQPAGGRARDLGAVPIAEAGRVLTKPALWPGASVAGVRLTEATRLELRTSYPRRVKLPPVVGPGLRLAYGASFGDAHRAPFPAFVEIDETAWPHAALGFQPSPVGPLTFGTWPLPQAGWIELGSTHAADHNDRSARRMWFAQLRTHGLYVTVSASSRKLLLEAVRSLRPLG